MDKAHWDSVYGKQHDVQEPSLFAQHCVESNIISPGQSVLELGHGDGRDALWFANKNIQVLGFDQSGLITENQTAYLCRVDFTDIDQMKLCLNGRMFDHVYSRFSWHSITEDGENKTLDLITEYVLRLGGSLLIECRTIYDALFHVGWRRGSYTFEDKDGHRRRFIDPGRLLGKLLRDKFSIRHAVINQGFAPYKDEDPMIMRIEAQYNG